jgi:hypothetical protein
MCVVCLDWEKGKLTDLEAMRALGEMIVASEDTQELDHYFEMATEIAKQIPGYDAGNLK